MHVMLRPFSLSLGFFVIESGLFVLCIVLESYAFALWVTASQVLFVPVVWYCFEIFILWLKIVLLFLIFFFSLKQDWQGAHGRTTWSYHCAVFVVFQRRCYRQRLDTPCGLSDLSPFHSNFCEQLEKRESCSPGIFSLNEDITEEIKKWDHFMQKL